MLIEDGILSREHLQEALDYQKVHGGLIGQILIAHGYIREENLVAALGRQLNIPYLPIAQYSINPESAALMDPNFCRKNLLYLFDHDERHVFVAMADPLNNFAVEEVENQLKRKAQVFLSTQTEIFTVLDSHAAQTYKNEIKKAG
ncbi:MAG: hypothetical protein HYZ84_00180 [Candidatus Omnitrophica bacterium]|nr:hypothetical protein [Candidatus Omnitrophota bacterium]